MQRALADGRCVLVRGTLPMALPVPPGWAVLRVRCDGPAKPLGVLREASFRALQWLGEEHALDAAGVARAHEGARADALVRALNRLAARVHGSCCLLVEGYEAADAASLALLRQWVSLPGTLRMPVVLAHAADVLEGDALALADALREAGAAEVRADAPDAPETDWGSLLRALGSDDLLTLRAAAVLGPRFEAGDVALARELPVVRVLEALQRARELGAPVDDLGDETFALADGIVRTLRGPVLPSLARHWQQRASARSRPAVATQMQAPRAVPSMPLARVVVSEGPSDATAPESAVRRSAPQPRGRRGALDGTVADAVHEALPPDATPKD